MKKIIFGVIIFMTILIRAKAQNIFVVGEDGSKMQYEDYKVLQRYAFLSGSDKSNIRRLNNLAYVSKLRNDLTYRATIQMLILEESTGMDYYLSDGINVIDTSNNENLINTYLKEYEKDIVCDNKTYEVGYKEEVDIDCGVSLYTYKIDNPNISLIDNGYISASAGGMQEINFTHEWLFNKGDYIYSNVAFYKDFSINLNVDANKIEFNIITPYNHHFLFCYGIYDEDDQLIETKQLETGYNELYFAKGQNVYVKELTDPTIYLFDEDMYFLDSNDTYKVDVIKEPREFKVTFNTYDKDTFYDDSFVTTFTDVNIYDRDYNYYTTIKCDGSCEVNLKSGRYIFEDNVSKFKTFWSVESNMEVNLYRFLVNGIMSDEEISSIKLNNENINFTKRGTMYLFDEGMPLGIYSVVINDLEYSFDLSNYSELNNYTFIRNIGMLYEFNEDITKPSDDEANESEDTDVSQEIEVDDEINISVPDTYIGVLENEKYVLFKKKRYYCSFDSYSYIN